MVLPMTSMPSRSFLQVVSEFQNWENLLLQKIKIFHLNINLIFEYITLVAICENTCFDKKSHFFVMSGRKNGSKYKNTAFLFVDIQIFYQ